MIREKTKAKNLFLRCDLDLKLPISEFMRKTWTFLMWMFSLLLGAGSSHVLGFLLCRTREAGRSTLTSAADLGSLRLRFLITCVDVSEVPKPPAVIMAVHRSSI